MLKHFLLTLISLAFVAFLFSRCSFFSHEDYSPQAKMKDFPNAKITSVRFVEQGTMAIPNQVRSFERLSDGRCLAKKANYDKADSTYCSQDVADRIYNCLKNGRLHKYKSNYRTKMHVLDGSSWSINVKFEDVSSIRSGGYMAHPNDFSAVAGFKDIIESLFSK